MPLAISPGEDKLGKSKFQIQHSESPDRAKLGGGHEPPIILRRQRNGNRKPMRVVSLHHHTTLSYRDGYGLPSAHIRRAEELLMPAIAMTEHGNSDSHVKAEIAAEGTGIKVIYGCEIYFGPTDEENRMQTKTHLTVLAKNAVGYRNLLSMITESYAKGFYYEPTVSPESLVRHKEGLIILSGCQGSLLFCSAVGGKHVPKEKASYKRALKVARWFRKNFGGDFFVEVQAFPELEATRRFNTHFAGRLARAIGARLCGTMDCHYTEYEESEIQMILHNLRGGNKKTIEEQAREWGYDVPLCPPLDDRSFYRRLRATGLSDAEAIQACVSTEDIAQECTVELPKLPMVRFKVPFGYGSVQEYWDQAIRDGWKYRGIDKLPARERARYKKQLIHEKSLIESKDYIDYFLIVREGVLFVKDTLNEPVGPARGSAAASVIAWLLRITEVDPLKFPLLVFERFIDETREDLPDIDLDFPSEVRPKLRDYYAGKYGDDCVNNIGTYTYFKSKLALDDVARVFHVPRFEVDRIKDFLIERSSGDLRASSTIEDTIEQFPQAKEVMEKYPDLYKSRELEGNIKGFGVHAAGLVISNEPLREIAAIYEREIPKDSGNWVQVVSLDKYDAERQGLVKMDFLGLSTMSIISACLRDLDMSLEDLYQLPLDDQKVYIAFRANDVVGVFQFDGRAMRYVCGSMKPDNFSEICDCNALARPGPLHNGAASEYAEIKHGVKLPDKFHPAVDVITAPTQYQIVYQEQILRIVKEVGDFPWTHAAYIRKIISRKIGEQEFNRQWDRFWEGCQTLHERTDYPPISEAQARKVWGNMITSGSYAFNAAHCVAYGLLAYWTMWFKVHHPAIFYARSLRQFDENPDKQRQLLRDAVKHDIDVLSPDPQASADTWKPLVSNGKIRRPAVQSGFKQISGVGDKVAKNIIDFREERGGLDSWWDLLDIRGIGPKTVDKIEQFVLQKDPFGVRTLDDSIAETKKLIRKGKLLRAPGPVIRKGLPLPTPTHTATDLPYEQGREFAVCWLGTILQRNIRDIFETNRAKTGEELDPKSVRNPELNEWALLTCEDEDDQLLLKIDRFKYPAFKEAIFDFRMGHDLLLVEGIRPRYVTARQILAKRLWTIEV
jgi:DNA polymerase-3 subunit alpha